MNTINITPAAARFRDAKEEYTKLMSELNTSTGTMSRLISDMISPWDAGQREDSIMPARELLAEKIKMANRSMELLVEIEELIFDGADREFAEYETARYRHMMAKREAQKTNH